MPLQQQKLSTDKPALLRRYPRLRCVLYLSSVFFYAYCHFLYHPVLLLITCPYELVRYRLCRCVVSAVIR